MGTYKGKLTVLSLGAVAVITALALSVPGPQGLAQEEKATKPSALTEGGGCCSSAKGGDTCCSARGGNCCCAKKLLAQADPEKKDEMKASKEAMAKGETARKAIEEHRKALAKDGVHSCCIKPSCTFCSTAGDMCPCAMNLRKGDPVCPECWGGWIAGHGRLEGIDSSKVQVIPKSKLKMMYDMKAMNFKKALGDSDKK